MKSVVLAPDPSGHGLMPELTETKEPSPGPGELAVKMAACGVCGTDLEKIRGEYTASTPVIGHEAVGIVTAIGTGVMGFKTGERVFPHHHVPDYSCYLCLAGNETMCDRYRTSNLTPGGFSEFFTVPKWNVERGGVLRLPGSMSFEIASLIEPLACCLRAVRKSHSELADSVLIAGAGPVGMMHALLLRPVGGRVMVSDVIEERLQFAEKLGFEHVLNAAKVDVPRQVIEETGGKGADVAIVASGSKEAIIQGLRSIRKGGRVCLFGIPLEGSVLDYDISELYNSEREILTSYGATETDTAGALKVLSSGGPEFGELITSRYPLSRFDEAIDAASGRRAMKVVVTP